LQFRLVLALPVNTFKSNSQGSVRSLSPVSEFSSDVLRRSSLVLVFRDGEEFSKSLFREGNEFLVILNSICNDQAFLGGDVIHNEFLKHSSIDL